MTDVIVFIADKETNQTYSQLPGVTKVVLSRASYSTPGSLEVWCTADPTSDAVSTSVPARFNPKQGIQVAIIDHSGALDQFFYFFIGLIDTAEQIDDQSAGISGGQNERQWHLMARDWLAVLADNPVQQGTWRSATPPRIVPFNSADIWDGNYVGDYTGTRPNNPGEQRFFIIADLCMNVIDNTTNGLLAFDYASAQGDHIILPNSRPIEQNFSLLSQTSILDAIRDLSRADPYDNAAPASHVNGYPTNGQCDGYDLANDYGTTASPGGSPYPVTAGFGAELQILNPNSHDSPQASTGRVVEYYVSGSIPAAPDVFAYPGYSDLSLNVGYTIIGYKFNQQGVDLSTRIHPAGQGEAFYNRPAPSTGGTGVVAVPDSENTWRPLQGLYSSRSEVTSYANSLTGSWHFEEQQPTNAHPEYELQAIKARALRDTAYADLFAGGPALQNARGGPLQGRITVVGPPTDSAGLIGTNRPITTIFRPGTVMTVEIEQLGITQANQNNNLTIKDWTYTWPDDQTVYDLSRLPYTASGTQLIDMQQRINAALTDSNKAYYSDWRSTDPTGVMTFSHMLGNIPSNITVEIAQWDGFSFVAGSTTIPLPQPGTVVTPPSSSFDASQGQFYGYSLGTATDQSVVVYLAYFVAWSDQSGNWLTRVSPNTIIRVKCYA